MGFYSTQSVNMASISFNFKSRGDFNQVIFVWFRSFHRKWRSKAIPVEKRKIRRARCWNWFRVSLGSRRNGEEGRQGQRHGAVRHHQPEETVQPPRTRLRQVQTRCRRLRRCAAALPGQLRSQVTRPPITLIHSSSSFQTCGNEWNGPLYRAPPTFFQQSTNCDHWSSCLHFSSIRYRSLRAKKKVGDGFEVGSVMCPTQWSGPNGNGRDQGTNPPN